MDILITGGTGLIGSALCTALEQQGHRSWVLSRQHHKNTPNRYFVRHLSDISSHQPLHAVINLAGASLADRRWTANYKRQIVDSRLQTTSDLIRLMSRLEKPPKILLSASAVGFYGASSGYKLTEQMSSGSGFAAELCHNWEQAALVARAVGVPVALLRFGVVLAPQGGALRQMAASFRWGVASYLGSGQQWLSWIHLHDAIAAIQFILHRTLYGPFNLSSPGVVNHRELCHQLQRHHRTLITAAIPSGLVRLLVGEMADEVLLQGQWVEPVALQRAGFCFHYPDLPAALDNIYRELG